MRLLLSDLLFALRTLRKSPSFTAIAVLTLAIAIGVNSAVFSLVDKAFLHPMVSNARGELAEIYTARKDAKRDFRQFSHEEYQALKAPGELFSDVGALTFALAGVGKDQSLHRSFLFCVSDNYFDLFGVSPAAGRFFDVAEGRPNADIPVVVASYNLWKRQGLRADFIGSTLHVNGRACTVIGVAPKGFSNGNALLAPELWIPLGAFRMLATYTDASSVVDLAHRLNFTLNLVGRLKPGLNLAAASARLSAYAERINVLHSEETEAKRELIITPPSRFSISTNPEGGAGIGFVSVLLLAMAGSVLLLASLNLANMLLARGATRSREIAIRLALGASRWQIIRQLLMEGLVLAFAGGSLGLALSLWVNSLLVRSLASLFQSINFSMLVDLSADPAALLATFGFCLFATLIFSLGPALQVTRPDMVKDLKQQSGDSAIHGKWNRFFSLRHSLVMSQIALALMLLFSAGLFFQAARKAGGLNLGFKTTGAVIAELDYSLGNAPEKTSRAQLLRIADEMKRLPGVKFAGLSSLEPFSNTTNSRNVLPAEAPKVGNSGQEQKSYSTVFASITPGYLDALGVRMLRGRDFTAVEASDPASAGVCIIDDVLARELAPDGEVLGRRLRYSQAPTDGSPAEIAIVGIVNTHQHSLIPNILRYHLYVPLAQAFSPGVFVHARLSDDSPGHAIGALGDMRRSILQVDPAAPILQLCPFKDCIERNALLWLVRLAALLFGLFGVIALLLAVVGVYGVKSYNVSRRTREIGIRMALGAHRNDILGLVMRQGLLQTLVSVSLGTLLALLAGRALSGMLFEVSPSDPLVLLISITALASTALLACWVPARRAATVNPTQALRSE